jgi:glutathione peroxidase-family protein
MCDLIFYVSDLNADDIDGANIQFAQFKGKNVVLVLNVASY